MKSSFILVVLLLCCILPPCGNSVAAADQKAMQASSWHYANRNQELPFSRSERTQSVWASGVCWSDCGSHCAWGQSGCLQQDAQGQCLKLTDACDRYCQRECRTSGGPLLPLDFFWE